jgi:hypothetical protein
MGFLTNLFWFYVITSCISAPAMGIRTYRMGIKKYGKRKSVVEAFVVAGLCLVIPYIGFCAMTYTSFLWVRTTTNEWVNGDPTSPKNASDPNFTPPPKKEKKVKPVESRFEIMDL